jgi:hypothetical protein
LKLRVLITIVLSLSFLSSFYLCLGIWGALNNSKKEEVTLETVEKVPKKPTIVIVDVSEEIPRGFGRGRGFGGGRGKVEVLGLKLVVIKTR